MIRNRSGDLVLDPLEPVAGGLDDFGRSDGRGRLVIVPVGDFDRRSIRSAEYAARVPAEERRALHVVSDDAGAWRLGNVWMAEDLPLPLHMVENEAGIAVAVRRVVEFELASEFDEVVVLAGRVGLRRRRSRLLHDRTADAIAAALAPNDCVTVALLTVALV